MSHPTVRLAAALADRYRIDGELGAGGMATVYLAHDLKHDRDVAIKVLHPDLGAALGGERFLSEIRTTARLQHPHILPLLDSGDADGLLYYVMPVVTGETLRARLDRERQLPIPDAVRIAREIASALDYAHRQGVIHRDIKPENILLHDGQAMVADFGIALAVQSAGGARMTQTGLSLGTPHYMSPEQAMGEKTIDARSDIYALGAVLYEMLIGEPPFSGASVQVIVAKVLTERPPNPTALRDTVPSHVESALLTALAKLPADRFATAAHFAEALASTSSGARDAGVRTAAASSRSATQRWSRRGIVAALGLAAIGSAYVAGRATLHASDGIGLFTVATLAPAPGETWYTSGQDFSMSPDGRTVVVRAERGSWRGLLLRTLDSLGGQPLPNTAGAKAPFWSPDGRSIAFFADGELKVIELASQAIRTLCPAVRAAGGTWGADGVILYMRDGDGTVFRAGPGAGECGALPLQTKLSSGAVPMFFADGRHFILSDGSKAWLGAVGDDSLTLLTTTYFANAVTAAPDYLLYVPNGSPMGAFSAQRVDFTTRKVVGPLTRILAKVPGRQGYSSLSASHGANLAAEVTPPGLEAVLGRFAPGGKLLDSLPWPPMTFGGHRYSHDGRRLAVAGWRASVLDLSRRLATELVAPSKFDRLLQHPVWSPGDTAIAYVETTLEKETNAIHVVDVKSGRAHRLAATSGRIVLTDWSRDGRYLAYQRPGVEAGQVAEAWRYDVSTGENSRMFAHNGDVSSIVFSPNGRQVAFAATTNGKTSVYVRTAGADGASTPVSDGAASSPRWSGDGRALFFMRPNNDIQSVQIGDEGIPSSLPQTVIPGNAVGVLIAASGDFGFDVRGNGDEFLVSVTEVSVRQLTVLMNWRALLPKR